MELRHALQMRMDQIQAQILEDERAQRPAALNNNEEPNENREESAHRDADSNAQQGASTETGTFKSYFSIFFFCLLKN